MPKCHHPGYTKQCKTPKGVQSPNEAVHHRATWYCGSCNSAFKSEVDRDNHKSKFPTEHAVGTAMLLPTQTLQLPVSNINTSS
ncbi:hypothetical protein NL676_021348 [Syzygium grande]|nr:hypothetical protein NL676_021348 [Syzygium grande]